MNDFSSGLSDAALFRIACLIGGEWIEGDGSDTLDVVNPSNGKIIGKTPRLGKAETLAAIDLSEAAQTAWAKESATHRANVLKRWFELIKEARADLARILTTEQGKPYGEALGEIDYAASYVEWFAEEARRIYGEIIPGTTTSNRLFVNRVPVGVAAAITPWNFPAAMIARKVAPAIAAGCSMIVKPSELTPYSAFALAVLAERAGFPSGLLQVITGNSKEIGDVLCASPIVRKLSFTGSTRVGRILMENCAPTLKRLSLELGGNAPFLVFDDAKLDNAVEAVIQSKFRNAGQTCVCTNRILVQSAVYDDFVERLTARVAQLRVGDGFAEGTEIGPLINEGAIETVQRHISDAVGNGAKLARGGNRIDGLFFEPTVVRDVTPEMLVASEETSGPLAPVFRFDTEEEAIRMANDTEFGLAAYFFTENHSRYIRVAASILGRLEGPPGSWSVSGSCCTDLML